MVCVSLRGLAPAALVCLFAISAHRTIAAGAIKEPFTMRAAAVVNDIIISTYDLDQRIKLVMVTSGSQRTAEVEKRLRPQVLRQLVDEMLQLQEAQKYNVKITQDDLDKNFKRIAQQNNITVDQINKMLDDNGIARTTLAEPDEGRPRLAEARAAAPGAARHRLGRRGRSGVRADAGAGAAARSIWFRRSISRSTRRKRKTTSARACRAS